MTPQLPPPLPCQVEGGSLLSRPDRGHGIPSTVSCCEELKETKEGSGRRGRTGEGAEGRVVPVRREGNRPKEKEGAKAGLHGEGKDGGLCQVATKSLRYPLFWFLLTTRPALASDESQVLGVEGAADGD